MDSTVYLNGAYLPKSTAQLSPDDRGFLFGDGVYEVVRAYGGRFFRLAQHVDRMARGLAALRIHGFDAQALADIAGALIDRNGLGRGDATVYVQVTRGAAPRTHKFPDPPVPPTVYAAAGALATRFDPAVGVAAITAPDTRWARCDIKTVGLLANCLAQQAAYDRGAVEAIFVRDGMALEGTHTSFFAVVAGRVVTAPATNYILPSITRGAVLEVCRAMGIDAEERPIELAEVFTAEELFLAGTTMEVMPIVTVDGVAVHSGTPGAVTTALRAHLRTLIEREVT